MSNCCLNLWLRCLLWFHASELSIGGGHSMDGSYSHTDSIGGKTYHDSTGGYSYDDSIVLSNYDSSHTINQDYSHTYPLPEGGAEAPGDTTSKAPEATSKAPGCNASVAFRWEAENRICRDLSTGKFASHDCCPGGCSAMPIQLDKFQTTQVVAQDDSGKTNCYYLGKPKQSCSLTCASYDDMVCSNEGINRLATDQDLCKSASLSFGFGSDVMNFNTDGDATQYGCAYVHSAQFAFAKYASTVTNRCDGKSADPNTYFICACEKPSSQCSASFSGDWTNQPIFTAPLKFTQIGCSGINSRTSEGQDRLAMSNYVVEQSTIKWSGEADALLDTRYPYLERMVFINGRRRYNRFKQKKRCESSVVGVDCSLCTDVDACGLCTGGAKLACWGHADRLVKTCKCVSECSKLNSGFQETLYGSIGDAGRSCQAQMDPQAASCGTSDYTSRVGDLTSYGHCEGTKTPGECVLPMADAEALCNSSPDCGGLKNAKGMQSLQLGRHLTGDPTSTWSSCLKVGRYCIQAFTTKDDGADVKIVIQYEAVPGKTNSDTFSSKSGGVFLNKCFNEKPTSIELQGDGVSTKYWKGALLYSSDGGQRFSPLICRKCVRFSWTQEIAVSLGTDDSWTTGNVNDNPTCFGVSDFSAGDACLLEIPAGRNDIHCVKVLTGHISYSADIDVYHQTKDGSWVQEDTWPVSGGFDKFEVVIDRCFNYEPKLKIKAISNEWVGHVLYSSNAGLTYRGMRCANCHQATATYSELQKHTLCGEHSWTSKFFTAPDDCMALILSRSDCSHQYFNHATHTDGNCGCVKIGADCTDAKITEQRDSTNIYAIQAGTTTTQAIEYAQVATGKVCNEKLFGVHTKFELSIKVCQGECKEKPRACDLNCCQTYCNSFSWCSHLTWYDDGFGGCRLYETCDHHEQMENAYIYGKVSGNAESVVFDTDLETKSAIPTKCQSSKTCEFGSSGPTGLSASLTLNRGKYLESPDDPLIDSGDHGTVCFWVKWNQKPEEIQYMVAAGGHSEVSFGHSSWVDSDEWGVVVMSKDTKGLSWSERPNPFPLNTWIHTCYSWVSGGLKVYLNGEQRQNGKLSARYWGAPRKHSPGLTINTANDARGLHSGAAKYDDISLWKEELSQEKIKMVKNVHGLDTLSFFESCKAWWKFDECLSDSSKQGLYPLFGLTRTGAIHESDVPTDVDRNAPPPGQLQTTTTVAVTTRATVAETVKKVLKGEMTFEVSNAAKFVKETGVKVLLTRSIAKWYEVVEEWVKNVTWKLRPRVRRLQRFLLSGPDVGDIDVEWKIVIPPDAQDTYQVEILAETFDSKTMSEATQTINTLIGSGLLGEDIYEANITWKYTVVENDEPPPEQAPEESSNIMLIVIISLCSAFAIVAMIATIFLTLKIRRQKAQEENPFLKLASEKNKKGKRHKKDGESCDFLMTDLLKQPEEFAPVTADEGRRLREFVQDIMVEDITQAMESTVYVSYSPGQRPEDAEGYGPGSYYAAAIVKQLKDSNIECFCDLMLPDDPVTRKMFCGQIGGKHSLTGCQILIVLQTAPLYGDRNNLREIYTAQSSKLDIIPLRFEVDLPSTKDVWPTITRTDMEGMLMVTSVIERFCKLNSIPSPPYTIINQPTVLQDLMVDLKKKIQEVTMPDNQQISPEIVGVGEEKRYEEPEEVKSQAMEAQVSLPSSETEKAAKTGSIVSVASSECDGINLVMHQSTSSSRRGKTRPTSKNREGARSAPPELGVTKSRSESGTRKKVSKGDDGDRKNSKVDDGDSKRSGKSVDATRSMQSKSNSATSTRSRSHKHSDKSHSNLLV